MLLSNVLYCFRKSINCLAVSYEFIKNVRVITGLKQYYVFFCSLCFLPFIVVNKSVLTTTTVLYSFLWFSCFFMGVLILIWWFLGPVDPDSHMDEGYSFYAQTLSIYATLCTIIVYCFGGIYALLHVILIVETAACILVSSIIFEYLLLIILHFSSYNTKKWSKYIKSKEKITLRKFLADVSMDAILECVEVVDNFYIFVFIILVLATGVTLVLLATHEILAVYQTQWLTMWRYGHPRAGTPLDRSFILHAYFSVFFYLASLSIYTFKQNPLICLGTGALLIIWAYYLLGLVDGSFIIPLSRCIFLQPHTRIFWGYAVTPGLRLYYVMPSWTLEYSMFTELFATKPDTLWLDCAYDDFSWMIFFALEIGLVERWLAGYKKTK